MSGLLIIATCNKLDDSIRDELLRHSRFERIYDITPPDDGLRKKYVKNWFDFIESRKICSIAPEISRIDDIVDLTAGWSFAKLKEL